MTVNRSHNDNHQSKVHVIIAKNKHWYPWLTMVAKVTTGTFVTHNQKISGNVIIHGNHDNVSNN